MAITPSGSYIENVSAGGVTSVSGDGVVITNSASTGAVTLAIAGTSGGIPYFSSATGWASSALLASGHVLLGGGAGTAPTSDAKLDDGVTTANTLTYTGTGGTAAVAALVGKVGTTAGVLSLAGSTSGTATITAPAVAGTSTNPVTSSNVIAAPTGSLSAPSFTFAGQSTFGMFYDGNVGVAFTAGSAESFAVAFNGVQLANNGIYAWSSGVLNISNSDTGISRASAGVVAVGTGAQGSAAGTLNATGYQAGGTAGVTAGNFTAVTSITTKAGLVTVLSGTSDQRLKKSKPYQGGLSKISAITPVSYFWNEKGSEQTGLSSSQEYVGFIAQDVQKVIPQAITATEKSKDGSETYLSLDDRPIIAALVNAVKELTARIQVLEEGQ